MGGRLKWEKCRSGSVGYQLVTCQDDARSWDAPELALRFWLEEIREEGFSG